MTFFVWPKTTILFSFQCPLFHPDKKIPIWHTKLWPYIFIKTLPQLYRRKIYLFTCVISCGNGRCSFSKLNKKFILITFSVQTNLTIFVGDTISENRSFALDIYCKLNHHISDQSIKIEQQVRPVSKMNGVEYTSDQTDLFKTAFNSIYLHVSWVSALQTSCDYVSKILPHIFLHNLTTYYQLMVHMLQMWHWRNFRSGVILNWWTVNITIHFNRMKDRTFICRSGQKRSIYQWLVIKTWGVPPSPS